MADEKALKITTRDLQDPLYKLYRSKVAEVVVCFLLKTPIRPNLITFLHIAIGLVASVLLYRGHDFWAVAAFEAHILLDVIDGELARRKNALTALGRVMDSIGDGIVFNAMILAGTLRIHQEFPNVHTGFLYAGVLLFAFVSAHSGVVYQLMVRKMGSIIKEDLDQVELEWREHDAESRKSKGLWLSRFGLWLDSLSIQFVSREWYLKILRRRDQPDWKDRLVADAKMMRELACKTRYREFERAVEAVSYVSDDNILSLVCISLFVTNIGHETLFPHVHPVIIAFSLGLFYALASLGLGLHFLQRFLHGVYRE